MAINIPLGVKGGLLGVDATSGKGVRLKLPINVGSGGISSGVITGGRQTQVLRAVAAATSISKADEALKTAKEAKDNPENVINPCLDENKLAELINAVNHAQDNPNDAPTPNDLHKAAASVVGVSAALVAAAHEKMKEDDVFVTNGREWVAVVDAGLLERAARAGAKEKMLDYVPSQEDRLTKLERRVTELEKVCKP